MKSSILPRRASLAVAAAVMTIVGPPAYAQQDRHSAHGQEFTGWSMPTACVQKVATASGAVADQPTGRKPAAGVKNRGDAQFLKNYLAEMEEMKVNFPTIPSGDPDVDFVRMTIEHHQGLKEASLRYLQDGEDEMIQKLAELMIVSQTGQIAMMCDWLEKHRR